jgi:probable phosphoglycerate mutase
VTDRPPPSVRTLGFAEDPGTRLVLVRHGEPTSAVAGIVGGPKGDTGLTERGRTQVATVAARLAASGELGVVDALYASSLPRAIETAELLAPALGDLAITVRHDLREHDPGSFDAMTWAAAIAAHPVPDFDTEPDTPIAPGGESLRGFHLRARTALREVVALHHGATVVVACHGGIVAAAIAMSFGFEAHRRLLLPTRFASMTEFHATPERFALVRYNDAYPLTDSR